MKVLRGAQMEPWFARAEGFELTDGLGAQMLAALNAAYPPSAWTMSDVLERSAAFSNDESVAEIMQNAVPLSHWAARDSPLPDHVVDRTTYPPLVPFVFLGTTDELEEHPTLLSELGIAKKDLRTWAKPSALHWTLVGDDLTIVLVAKDRAALEKVAKALPSRTTLPTSGWTSL